MRPSNDIIIKQFSKYIDRIILPKYPEIIDYEIEVRNYPITDYISVNFIFYMDGSEYDIEQEIVDKCLDMMEVFGMSNINYGFSFENSQI